VTGFWFLTMSNMFRIIRPYAGRARFGAYHLGVTAAAFRFRLEIFKFYLDQNDTN